MKIEQVLVHYLLRNKKLTLQGIGTFQLEGPIPESDDPDRPVVIPENSISFQYDPRAAEDDGLVNFIVIHTRKIKPLASSDLESFLSLGRQFLNIGNPFVLQNLGTLEKLSSGELAFKPGHMVAQKMETQKIKSEEPENTPEEENLFNDYQQDRKKNSGSKAILAIIALLILGALGWVVWYYGFSKKSNVETLNSTESVVPVSDSSRLKKDSLLANHAVADSSNNAKNNPDAPSTFKIVVRQYRSKDLAVKRLELLKSYRRNVIMYTNDSVIYKLAEPFRLPLSDTTKILDSLKRYYTRVFVEVP